MDGRVPGVLVVGQLGAPLLILAVSDFFFGQQVDHGLLPEAAALLDAVAPLALAEILLLNACLLRRHEFAQTLLGQDALLRRLFTDLAGIVFADGEDGRGFVGVGGGEGGEVAGNVGAGVLVGVAGEGGAEEGVGVGWRRLGQGGGIEGRLQQGRRQFARVEVGVESGRAGQASGTEGVQPVVGDGVGAARAAHRGAYLGK